MFWYTFKYNVLSPFPPICIRMNISPSPSLVYTITFPLSLFYSWVTTAILCGGKVDLPPFLPLPSPPFVWGLCRSSWESERRETEESKNCHKDIKLSKIVCQRTHLSLMYFPRSCGEYLDHFLVIVWRLRKGFLRAIQYPVDWCLVWSVYINIYFC